MEKESSSMKLLSCPDNMIVEKERGVGTMEEEEVAVARIHKAQAETEVDSEVAGTAAANVISTEGVAKTSIGDDSPPQQQQQQQQDTQLTHQGSDHEKKGYQSKPGWRQQESVLEAEAVPQSARVRSESSSPNDVIDLEIMALPTSLQRNSSPTTGLPRQLLGTQPGAFPIASGGFEFARRPQQPQQATTRSPHEDFMYTSDAELVTDDDEDDDHPEDPEAALPGEVIMGRSMDDHDDYNTKPASHQRRQHRIGWVILSCLAAVGILVLILVAVISNNSGISLDDDPTIHLTDNINNDLSTEQGQDSTDSTIAKLEVYPVFWNDSTYFHSSVVNAIMDANNPNNAMYLANKWMINDPYLDNYTKEQHMQRFFLVALYYMFNGDYWFRNDNWLTYDLHGECNWYMNTPSQDDQELYRYKFTGHCDDEYNYIVIDLKDNNLTGLGQEVFVSLNFVEYYDVSYNRISGRPLRSPYMPRAEIGVASHNELTGFMANPRDIGRNTNVRVLKLDGNNIMGGGDATWWQWFPNLEIYNVTGNQLSSQLSSAIQYSPKLRYIGIANNFQVGGTLPLELGLLSNLRVLDVSGNINVGGSIPSKIASLNNLTLNIEGTSINGSIPTEICQRLEDDNDDLEIIANCSMVECCSEE